MPPVGEGLSRIADGSADDVPGSCRVATVQGGQGRECRRCRASPGRRL